MTGSPNGLTRGPDGAIYYSDFDGGHVFRTDDMGQKTQVSTMPLGAANGVLFDADGTLLVLDYNAGVIWRLTLGADHRETGRQRAGMVANAALDGIARDDAGRFYLTDNDAGTLHRTDATFGAQEPLLTGLSSPASIAFGKGALACHDVYVAASGALGVFHGDRAGMP
jgi:sugar lactone lactonase YvrE